MDFSKTRISAGRRVSDYSKVQSVMSVVLRGRRFQIRQVLASGKTLINLGCGSNVDERFINLDCHWRPGVDLCWDLKDGIPLPDNCLTGAFTEHCLEHLSFDLCRSVLSELYRSMKRGARVRLVVPDAELYLNVYHRNHEGEKVAFPYVASELLSSGQVTPMMAVNDMFRGHGHLYAYDFETLRKLTTEAGFVEVVRCAFRRGGNEDLLIDAPSRSLESLYVEATKAS